MSAKYKCERCNNIISVYKENTKTRRKCSKCGSYHVVRIEENSKAKGKTNKEKFPFVSVIIVNYNGKRYLDDCFNALFSLNYPKEKIEIILVDNHSTDDSVDYARNNFPTIKVIQNNINNYCKANNIGIRNAKGDFIALLNNDTKVDKNWLIELIKAIQSDEKIGVAGSKVLFEDGKINTTGQIQYPNFYWSDRGFGEKDKGQYNKTEEVDSLCGVSVLYKKECLDNIGLLDEDFIMYCEDIDMALRCKQKGWRIMYVSKSIVYHKYHGTGYVLDEKKPSELAKRYVERNRLLLIAKHFPEKLPDALSSSTFFYIEKEYDWLYEALPVAVKELVELHPKSIIEKIVPKLFRNLRKIIIFEKDAANIESELKVELKKRYDEIKILKQDKEKIFKGFEEKKKSVSVNEAKIKELEKKSELKKNELRLYKEHARQEIERMKKEHGKYKRLVLEREKRIKDFEKKLVLKTKELDFEREQSKLQLKNMEQSLRETQRLLKEKREELNQIYNSKTFKLFVSNIWNIKDGLKHFLKKKDEYNKEYYELIFSHTKKLIKNFKFDYFEKRKEIEVILEQEPSQIAFNQLKSKLIELIKALSKNRDDEKKLRYQFSYYTLIPFVKPRGISIDISDKCNLQCKICNQWKDNNKKKKLNFKDIRGLIDQISDIFPKTIIEFSGQEPLLKKELLLKSFEYGKAKNVELALSTNGILIDQKTAVDLVNVGLHHTSVSLDSVNPEIHDYLRNKQNSFKKTVQALQYLIHAKKQNKEIKTIISVTTVITNRNLDELLPLYSFAKKLGVEGINFNAYVPDNSYFFDKDASYNDEFWVKKENIPKLKRIIDKIINLKKRNIKPIIGNDIAQLNKIPEYFEKKQDFDKRICIAGYNYFHITNFGELTVCGKGPYLNIRKYPLNKIWNSYEFMKTRQRVRECKMPCINNCFELA